MRKKKHSGWGGRREGAGRPPGPNPRVPHLRREKFSKRLPVHVILEIRKNVPSLRSVRLRRELEQTFAEVELRDFRLVRYALKPDRAELIVEAQGNGALEGGMRSLCPRFSRAVNRVFQRRGTVFQDRYRSRLLRTPGEVRAAMKALGPRA